MYFVAFRLFVIRTRIYYRHRPRRAFGHYVVSGADIRSACGHISPDTLLTMVQWSASRPIAVDLDSFVTFIATVLKMEHLSAVLCAERKRARGALSVKLEFVLAVSEVFRCLEGVFIVFLFRDLNRCHKELRN